jgi:hypothetical protein
MNLLEKPIILLVNKMDVEGAQEIYDGIRDTLHNLKGKGQHDYRNNSRRCWAIPFTVGVGLSLLLLGMFSFCILLNNI